MAHTPRCPSPLYDSFTGSLLHIMHRLFPLTVLFCFSPKLLCFPFVFRLSHSILNFNQLKHQISHNMNRKLAFFQRDSAARCDFFCVCICVWRRFSRVSTFMHSNFATLARVARGAVSRFFDKNSWGVKKKQKFVFVAYVFHAFPVRSCYCKGAASEGILARGSRDFACI